VPRTYLIFGHIEGKLDVLRVECTKCDRKGRYHVHKLIEKYGHMGNQMKWREMLNADCPKRDASQLHEPLRHMCGRLPASGIRANANALTRIHWRSYSAHPR
jgi:hypothetical protein